MIVALDVEDTITAHPAFFAFLSRALVDAGHSVIIITMRDDRENLEAELKDYGIQYTELVTADEETLGRQDAVRWKGEMCRTRGVEVMFEDSPENIKHLDQSILVFLPV